MIDITVFTFNPFQENTYVLFDDTKECVIIDPGCYSALEKKELEEFILGKGLKPVHLLNTHCHIDHILGNKFICDRFGLKPELHEKELLILNSAVDYGATFGVEVEASPPPEHFINVGAIIKFGSSELKAIFTPGHSPGSLSFYNKEEKFVVDGDVLFLQSIGRTDLPGGDYKTLIKSVEEQLFTMEGETKVYPGHGPMTTIGFEKENNPFF